MLTTMYADMGSRWSEIVTHLPGRTDNQVKNHYNGTIKRRLRLRLNQADVTPDETILLPTIYTQECLLPDHSEQSAGTAIYWDPIDNEMKASEGDNESLKLGCSFADESLGLGQRRCTDQYHANEC